MTANDINDLIKLVYSRYGFTLFAVDNGGKAFRGKHIMLNNKRALTNLKYVDYGVTNGSHDCLGFHESGRSAWVEGKTVSDTLKPSQKVFSNLVIDNNCFDAIAEEQRDGRVRFTERSESNNVFYVDKKGNVLEGCSVYDKH